MKTATLIALGVGVGVAGFLLTRKRGVIVRPPAGAPPATDHPAFIYKIAGAAGDVAYAIGGGVGERIFGKKYGGLVGAQAAIDTRGNVLYIDSTVQGFAAASQGDVKGGLTQAAKSQAAMAVQPLTTTYGVVKKLFGF